MSSGISGPSCGASSCTTISGCEGATALCAGARGSLARPSRRGRVTAPSTVMGRPICLGCVITCPVCAVSLARGVRATRTVSGRLGITRVTSRSGPTCFIETGARASTPGATFTSRACGRLRATCPTCTSARGTTPIALTGTEVFATCPSV